VVTVVSFTLMGIEGIADEIEMPFGTDDHDLPLGVPGTLSSLSLRPNPYLLDRLCNEVRVEIEYVYNTVGKVSGGPLTFDCFRYIIGRLPEGSDEWED
jgi:putative membrane protein